MRIGFDFDGVITDFRTPYIKLVNDYFNKNYSVAPEDNETWNTYDQYEDFTPEMQAEIFKVIGGLKNFWLNDMYPFRESDLQLIRNLLWAGINVYFVTNRYANPDDDTTLFQCRNWLLRYDINATGVILTRSKARICKDLQIDYFIDDKIGNVKTINEQSKNTVCYIMDRKYNQDYETIFRVKTIKEFIDKAKEGYYNGENERN